MQAHALWLSLVYRASDYMLLYCDVSRYGCRYCYTPHLIHIGKPLVLHVCTCMYVHVRACMKKTTTHQRVHTQKTTI